MNNEKTRQTIITQCLNTDQNRRKEKNRLFFLYTIITAYVREQWAHPKGKIPAEWGPNYKVILNKKEKNNCDKYITQWQ